MLVHHRLEAAREGVVGEFLAPLDILRRKHVLFMHLEQVADVALRGRADPGHGLLGGRVHLAAERVDLVCHVLLRSRLQRIFQRLVENDALFRVDGQLVDQRVLGGDLVVQRIDEGLEHGRVALERLALGQKLLLLRLLFVVFGRKLRALALEVGSGLLVCRGGDPVLDIEQQRVELFDPLLRLFQRRHRALAALDHLDEALLGGLVSLVEDRLLVLEDADDGVRFRKQFLQVPCKRHVAHAIGAQALHLLP